MHEITDLDCRRHPDMAGIVTIGMDGRVHFHAHVEKGTFVSMLADVVELLRAELLAEA